MKIKLTIKIFIIFFVIYIGNINLLADSSSRYSYDNPHQNRSRGEVIIDAEDYIFPRYYRSQAEFDGPLGHNWDSPFFQFIEKPDSSTIVYVTGTGLRIVYSKEADGYFYARGSGSVSYFRENSDGSTTLIGPQLETILFNKDNRLQAISDSIGNDITFFYDDLLDPIKLTRVSDAYNRFFNLIYDTSNRLQQLIDFEGQVIATYTYDSNGNLDSVTGPKIIGTPTGNDFPQGKTESYTYSSGFSDERLNHNILSINPSGISFVYSSELDPTDPQFDRHIQTLNLAGESTTNTYDPAMNITQVKNPSGDIIDIEYDSLVGYITKVTAYNDGLSYSTSYEYNNPDLFLTKITYPGGDSHIYTYDSSNTRRSSQSNLLSAISTSTQGKQSTRHYAYEPIFNQMISMTDPEGLLTTFVYDYQEETQENLISSLAAQYALTTAEVTSLLSGAVTGLGDRNGDGITSQIKGNLIEEIGSPVDLSNAPEQAALEGDSIQDFIKTYIYGNDGRLISNTNVDGMVTAYFYHPGDDPNGDGLNKIVGGDPEKSGYLSYVIIDGTLPTRPDKLRCSGFSVPLAFVQIDFETDERGNVTGVTDGNGIHSSYVYNQLNQLVQSVYADNVPAQLTGQDFKYEERIIYDAENRVVREEADWIDPHGSDPQVREVYTDYAFTNKNQTLTITNFIDDKGGVIQESQQIIQYKNGFLSSITSSEGVITTYRYDGLGRRTQIIFNDNNTDPYDALDENSSVTTWVYDDLSGNVLTMTDALGNSTTQLYDEWHRLSKITGPLGNSVDYARDIMGRVTETTVTGNADYLLTTKVELSKDRFFYDSAGRLIRTESDEYLPSGVSTRRPYEVDSDGMAVATFQYDRSGRLTFASGDRGFMTSWEYDALGRSTTIKDPNGNTVSYLYDKNSNLVSTTSTYVSPEALVPNLNHMVTYTYDSLNRLTSQTVDGATSKTYYDSNDLMTMTEDFLGHRTYYERDGLGRIVRIDKELIRGAKLSGDEENLLTVSCEYDTDSKYVSVTNPKGHTINFDYDYDSRKSHAIYADGTTIEKTFDKNGLLLSYLDAQGNLLTYTRDARGLTTQVDVSRAPSVIGTTVQKFAYDGRGNLNFAYDNNEPSDSNDDTAVKNSYDSLGQIVESEQYSSVVLMTNGSIDPMMSDQPQIVSWWYTGGGLLKSLLYPDGRRLDYTYNPMGLLKSVSTSNGMVQAGLEESYSYLGPMILQTKKGNGVVVDIEHDGKLIPSSTTYSVAGIESSKFTYSNDDMSRLQVTTREHSTSSLGLPDKDDSDYDDVSRVVISDQTYNEGQTRHIHEWEHSKSSLWSSYSVKDLLGNTLKEYDIEEDTLYSQYSRFEGGRAYNENRQLKKEERGDLGITRSMKYDAFGRLREILVHKIDDQQITSGASATGFSISGALSTGKRHIYKYDALGRIREIQNGSALSGSSLSLFQNKMLSRFTYSGNQMIQENIGSGAVRQFVRGGLGLNSFNTNQKKHYYIKNRNHITGLMDSAGNVVERMIHTHWGVPDFQDSNNKSYIDAGDKNRSKFGNPFGWNELYFGAKE